jgi:hypothetical protein
MGDNLGQTPQIVMGQLNPVRSIKPLKYDYLRSGRNICGAQLDLLPQLLVLVITTLSMPLIGLVIKRAGGKAGYLAGLRN